MRPSLCQSCLTVLLKFFSFLQTFVGVSVVIYSLWVLNGWRRRGLPLDLDFLPAPWFVCASMGVGILVCLISITGHVAAESVSGCCLCFYTLLSSIFIILEAALVGDLVLNKHWEQDLPYDATGEMRRLRVFIEDNMDISKLVCASLIVIQAVALLLAVIIRALIPTRTVGYDSDEDFFVIRRPLINPLGDTPYVTTSVESKPFHSDIWSSMMRQKYGLNKSEYSYNVVDPTAPASLNDNADEGRQCSIQ